MTLETITGNLRDAYKQLQPGTMLYVDQLMNERRINKELCCHGFYTADGEVYFLDGADKTPTLAITREAHNPVLQNIDDAFKQLVGDGNYRPSQADVQKAIAAHDTVLVTLPNLRLSGNEAEWSYLNIGTTPAEYAKLNQEELKFAERVYGQGDDFAKNMKMLKNAKIGETKIFVLNSDYVQKQAEAGAIARASWLFSFDVDSRFYTNVRYFDDRDRVRGVRRGASVSEQEAPAGRGAQNNSSTNFPTAVQSLSLSPEQGVVLEALKPYVAPALHQWLGGIVPPNSSYGDVMQRISEGNNNISEHSYKEMKGLLNNLYFKK